MKKTWEEVKKLMIEKLDSYVWEFESISGVSYGGSIYKDYRDEISDATIRASLMNADRTGHHDFYMSLVDKFTDPTCDNDQYEFDALFDRLKTDIGNDLFLEFENEIRDWCYEHIFFQYNMKDWDRDVYINVFLDCGDANFEGDDCVYNFYANEIPRSLEDVNNYSALKWLAIQQGIENQLDSAIREYATMKSLNAINSRVAKSYIEEWQNLTSSISALVFSCKMSLFDALKVKSKALRWTIQYGVRTSNMPPIGTIKSKLKIEKDCVCGLVDYGNGGGSIRDIQLVKDVEIPLDAVMDITIEGANDLGYSVEEIYGCTGCDARCVYIEKGEN